jgi:hypothetical protein
MYNPEIDRPQRDRCYHCKGTGKTPSPWPDSPGFYWWRGAPSFRWEMMHILAYGDEDDQSRYMVQKAEGRQVMRSLKVWKENGPECGEWVKVHAPVDACKTCGGTDIRTGVSSKETWRFCADCSSTLRISEPNTEL